MSLERSWSPTAVQMFSQGLGSSLLVSTRNLDHSGICSTLLDVLSPSLGPCQLPRASGNNFPCQESISYFSSISERWLARMIDASHHPYKLSLQLRHQQAQGPLQRARDNCVGSVEHSHSNQLGHLLSVVSPGTHCLSVTNCH